jgi:hypothetical protein
MNAVGVLARFEMKPGKDAEIREFFKGGLAVVQQQPVTTTWFAFRMGPTTYGAFAAFASEEDRAILLATGGPISAARNAELFVRPPTFEKVDVLEARLR